MNKPTEEPQPKTEQLSIEGEEALADDSQYLSVLSDVMDMLAAGRQAAARSVNSIMTVSYWKIGWRIVESEQCGDERASYGESLINRLSVDLKQRVWARFFRAQPRADASVLFALASSRDRACRICLRSTEPVFSASLVTLRQG